MCLGEWIFIVGSLLAFALIVLAIYLVGELLCWLHQRAKDRRNWL